MGHFFSMPGLFIALFILFLFLLFTYQKDAIKKQNEKSGEKNSNDPNIEDSENIVNDESKEEIKYNPKILTVPITAVAAVLGVISAVNLTSVLKGLFTQAANGSFYKFLSIAGSSSNIMSIFGLLYIAAAAISIFGPPNMALRLISLTAYTQAIVFILYFILFGFFSVSEVAIPFFVIFAAVIYVTALPVIRKAFGVRHNELFWQDTFFIIAFILLFIGFGITINYYASNYPHSIRLRQSEDFSSTGPAADADDTVEIYGFAFRMPKRIEIVRAEHVDAGGINSVSGYDTAVFSDGVTDVSIVTRGGMPMEQLFEKANLFDIPDALKYSEKFIFESCGIAFIIVKAQLGKYYNYVKTTGWSGYAEQPAEGMKNTPVWSYNLWSAGGNDSDAVRITFDFKGSDDATAAVKLVNNVISSLIVRGLEKRPGDPMKLAAAEIGLKNYTSAKIYIADALALNYKNVDAHYYMAFCLYSGGTAGAKNVEFHLSRALQLDPAHAGALDIRSKLAK